MHYEATVAALEDKLPANTFTIGESRHCGLTQERILRLKAGAPPFGRKEDSEKELAIASRIEHEEVEKHQNVLRIMDPDQFEAQEHKPDSSN